MCQRCVCKAEPSQGDPVPQSQQQWPLTFFNDTYAISCKDAHTLAWQCIWVHWVLISDMSGTNLKSIKTFEIFENLAI